ncbi:MAG: site-specific integrase [Clostridia bacterium]
MAHIFTTEEINTILNRFKKNHCIYYAFLTAYCTGLRIAEVFALTWDDIDFKNKTISVNKNILKKNQAGGTKGRHLSGNSTTVWYIGTTKTKSGERQIHISPTLMKALVNFKNRQMELRLLYGKDYKYYHFEEIKNQYGKVLEYQIIENQSNILSMKLANMIFTRDNGKYCGTDIIKYPYKIIHDKLGIKNCRFYDLRGSYATTILRNGVEIRDVADVLGHKDIETTENYYISSTDETRKNVTDSYESTINLDVIKEIIEYKISM